MDAINTKVAESHGFIDYLKGLLEREDGRAAMANLRRGLGKPPGTVFEMDRYILSQVPGNVGTGQEKVYYLVAALFAFWHQGKEKAESLEGERNTDRNLGKSLQRLVDIYVAEDTSPEPPKETREKHEMRLEKRLNALLNAHLDDLPDYLRQVVSLLKSKDILINWVQLLNDIQRWDTESRIVQHEWAKGFWVSIAAR